MAATNLNALLRAPGRLCVNPTDLSLGFPGGGEDLGLVRDVVARPGRRVKKLREEGLGATTKHGLGLGYAWAITAALRALEQGHASSFFETATGATTGEEQLLHNPVETPPGEVLATVAVLFWPFDEVNQDFVYMPAAIAYPEAAAAMKKSIQREGLVLVAFDATPRSSDGLAAINARKEDLEDLL